MTEEEEQELEQSLVEAVARLSSLDTRLLEAQEKGASPGDIDELQEERRAALEEEHALRKKLQAIEPEWRGSLREAPEADPELDVAGK